MPVVIPLAAAAITAGGTLASSAMQSGANAKAAQTQAQAAQNATATQLQMYTQTRADQTPWRVTGEGALQQLGQLYNIQVPTGTYADLTSGPGSGKPTSPGLGAQPDYAAYVKNNPDLLAQYQSQSGYAKGRSMADYGQQMWSQFDNAGRTYTPYGAAPNGYDPNNPNGSAPAQTAPSGAPDYSSFYNSPDYQFARDQGLAAVDARQSAMGNLDSGATRKAEETFASGLASQNYNNYTSKLMGLAGAGQTAASSTDTAGTNTANQLTNVITNQGNNQASSYLGQGQLGSTTAQTLAGLAGGVLNNTNMPWNQKTQINPMTNLGAGYNIPSQSAAPLQLSQNIPVF